MRYVAYITSDGASGAAVRLARKLGQLRVPNAARVRLPSPKSRKLGPLFLPSVIEPDSVDIGMTNRTALDQSGALIVLCNAESVRSPWVNAEIAHFISNHGIERVVSVMVDGVQSESSVSLPPRLIGAGVEPLAADMRTNAEPERIAIARIAAGALGWTFDDFVDRWRLETLHRRIQQGLAGALAIASIAWLAFLFNGMQRVETLARQSTSISGDAMGQVCRHYEDLGQAAARMEDGAPSPAATAAAQNLREQATRMWLACARHEERWGTVGDWSQLYCPPSWARVPEDIRTDVQCPEK